MKQTYIPLCILCVLLCSASLVRAHGTGVSYEESKEGYLIDIGHDEFIAADEATRFDFALYPEDITLVEEEPFTDVWVTITRDKKLSFAGGIHKPEFGATGFTVTLPEEGTYLVNARFQKEGETVVKTEFPLQVIKSLEESEDPPEYFLYALCALSALLCGTALGLFIPRK